MRALFDFLRWCGTPRQWATTFAYVSLMALAGGFAGYIVAEHAIAAHFYHHCREELGLFEPMTTLQKGQSACAQRLTEELGIENRWKEELP